MNQKKLKKWKSYFDLKEKRRKIPCGRCGREMMRIGPYEYYCCCNPNLGVLVA